MEKTVKITKKKSPTILYNMKKSLKVLRKSIPKGKIKGKHKKKRTELYEAIGKLNKKEIKKIGKALDKKFRFSRKVDGKRKQYTKKELYFKLNKYFYKNTKETIPDSIINTPTTPNLTSFKTEFDTVASGIKNEMTVDLSKIGINNLVKLILNNAGILSGANLVLQFGDTHYTLNEINADKLESLLKGTLTYTNPNITGSDMEVLMELKKIDKVKIYRAGITDTQGQASLFSEGSFFKYTHNIKHDKLIKAWKRYGIFDRVRKRNYNVNCLARAFKEGGMLPHNLEKLKLMFVNRSIPVSKFSSKSKNGVIYETGLVDLLNININITRPRKTEGKTKTYTKTYNTRTPDEYTETYNLGLIDNHYFIIDKYTSINRYALEHYEELKDKKGFYNYSAKNTRQKRYIDSYKLIDILLKKKEQLLTPITNCEELYKSTFYENISDWGELDYIIDTNTKYIETSKAKDLPPQVIFFDFEASTDGKKHKEYMIGYKRIIKNEKSLKWEIHPTTLLHGQKCSKYFLKQVINQDTLLIAHNLSYDFQFILKHLIQINNPIERGKQMLQTEGKYYNHDTKKIHNVLLKDSAALIAMPLSKFGECFHLKQEKEVMPYGLYTEKNIYKQWVKMKEAREILNNQYYLTCTEEEIEEKIKDFEEGVKKYGDLKKDGSFNCIKYAEFYCKMDVEVLYQGYTKFREWMKELTNLDIYNMVSITQLAHNFFIEEGCYDGVYQLSGVPRAFISKCIVGGRCMTNNNERQSVKMLKYKTDEDLEGTVYCKEGIADFDACSLYPSAQKRMKGYLKGVPKVIEGDMITNKELLHDQDGFFVEIRINAIGRELDFPLLSIKNDEGVREFTNDLVGKLVMVDKITLQEVIKHHKIDYTVIKGYYFNEGHNPQINKSIEKLFQGRLEKKKEKNPIQQAYKLIMNSAYGRTLLKPLNRKTKIIRSLKKKEQFQRRYFNHIISFNEIEWGEGDGYNHLTKFTLVKPINDHFSIPQVGVEILATSKVIMSEVMITAQDLGYKIYYTDTDSMHINMEEIKPLVQEFKRKYNRELIGKNLGQFHTDFDLKGADESKCEIYSKQLIALGKKSYIDVLVGKDKNGKEVIGHHLRMKGIPQRALTFEAKNNHHGDYVKMYSALYQSKDIAFDLLCRKEGFAGRSHFIKNKDYSYSFPDLNKISTDDFIRKVHFKYLAVGA